MTRFAEAPRPLTREHPRQKARPALVVLSTLFPRPEQPTAGLFIRERMARVARGLPLAVVSPVPWFPLQFLIRFWRPHFRPGANYHEEFNGIPIFHPRFVSFPGILKSFDGLFMALGCYRTLRTLRKEGKLDVIDAHFLYPEGRAASWLGRWLDVPFTVTARGTEARLVRKSVIRYLMRRTVAAAGHIFAVSSSLKRIVLSLGASESRVTVVGNAVDTAVFHPVEKGAARAEIGVPRDAPVMISVGGLVERKGHHRVIECLPELKTKYPELLYLIVGGPSPEGDWTERLRRQISELRLNDAVRLLGTMSPEKLKIPLSAADVFVLATRNEGWANVFLEAMACGLPVVTTDVGGNRDVITSPELGSVVPFDDRSALETALADALSRNWDRQRITNHAASNDWDKRIRVLQSKFQRVFQQDRRERA